MFRRMVVLTVLVGVWLSVGFAQAPGQGTPAQAPPSTKAVVVKGRAPVSNDVLEVKLPRPVESDLPNGIHLMVLEDHRLPQVTMQVIVPGAGGYYDPADQPGLATITAATMIEGTKTRTAQQIAQQLEQMAATVSMSGAVSGDAATMFVSSLSGNFDQVLALAADVLLNPVFPEQEVARYRQRTKASLTLQRSQPTYLAYEMVNRVIYGSHPASRSFLTPDALDKAMSAGLAEFHKAHYVPDFAIVAIAGDVTAAEARAKIEQALGGWKKAGIAKPRMKDPDPIGPAKVHLVDRANSVQSSVMIGTQAINRVSPDYDVVKVLDSIIGGGPTGRLFLNLREEKGWTYGAYSSLTAPAHVGDWVAQAEVRTDVTEGTVSEIMREAGRLRDERVPAKEFADKKRSLVASFALGLESPQMVLANNITRYRYNLPIDYWDKYPERVMAVTEAQVQAAARKYLDPARLQIVVVGEGGKVIEPLKKFGPVEVYDTEGKRKGN